MLMYINNSQNYTYSIISTTPYTMRMDNERGILMNEDDGLSVVVMVTVAMGYDNTSLSTDIIVVWSSLLLLAIREL